MALEFVAESLNVIGWERIIPELATFFVTVKKVKEEGYKNGLIDLSPCNLFLTGLPGTNKTGGAMGIGKFFSFVTAMIDIATVDDIGEVIGITNLAKLSQTGEAELVRGETADAEVMLLDEILNIAPHVARQGRQLLQGHYKAYGRTVPLNWKTIISTGNTDADMEGYGQMVTMDLPTAKRFLMTVKVPSLREMSREAQKAVIRWKIDPELRQRERARFA